MMISKRRIKSIEFSGIGIKIVPVYDRMLSLKWDIAIMSMGCISNLILSGVIILFGISPLYDLACVSFSLGLFNLLPFKQLDGGSIISLLQDYKSTN
ncbi:MAG: site-2 protease family protein [Oscillospiraceae bacterium]